MDLKFERATDEEMALVYSAWCDSWRQSPWAGVVRNDLFQSVHRATIAGLLERGAVCTVALAPVVPNVFTGRRVMAFAVTEPQHEALHFLYVKNDYRRKGVGRALLNHVAGAWFQPVYTHRTRGCAILLPKKWRWNPVLARVKTIGEAVRH